MKKPANSSSRVSHLAATFMVISHLAYTSTLKIELKYPSETSADFLWSTLCYIPEERILHSQSFENFNPKLVKNIGT
jgi:hypothetical protein